MRRAHQGMLIQRHLDLSITRPWLVCGWQTGHWERRTATSELGDLPRESSSTVGSALFGVLQFSPLLEYRKQVGAGSSEK